MGRQRFLASSKTATFDEVEQERTKSSWAIVRGPDGSLYRVKVPQGMTSDEEDAEESVHSVRTAVAGNKSQRLPHFARNSPSLPKYPEIRKRSIKVGVEVEDASDTEDEGNPLKSVWNNRRPSPGVLMEPVEIN